MSAFYDSETWLSFGQGHPGGREATKALLRRGGLVAGDRLLDLCCGLGDSTALAASLGLDVLGIDREPAVARAAQRHPDCTFLTWSGGMLPLEAGRLDAVLCECSLSQLERRDAVLREIRRCLKPKGRLLLSDLYDGVPLKFSGFSIECWEDQTPQLREFSARWIWETGSRFPCGCKGSGYFAACYRAGWEEGHGF